MRWVDTHCHLDAPEFAPDALAVRQRATQQGVTHCVIPAVELANFHTVRALAHAGADSYCLGIHPLYVQRAGPQDLALLDAALAEQHADPRLVAVGEIGLDGWVPGLDMTRQKHFYRAQLTLAQRHGLPVVA